MEEKKVRKSSGKRPVKAARVKWPFPRTTLEKALGVTNAIKNHNGGNSWEPEEIRKAIGAGVSNSWFYLAAASRDYGLTLSTNDPSA